MGGSARARPDGLKGGRQKWLDEGRPLTQERPQYPAEHYTARGPDLSIRALRHEALISRLVSIFAIF